jgi:hypothetical protein
MKINSIFFTKSHNLFILFCLTYILILENVKTIYFNMYKNKPKCLEEEYYNGTVKYFKYKLKS